MDETIVKEEPVIEVPSSETPAEVTEEVKPGEKTDPALLLESLRKEREDKRKEREARIAAETELKAMKATPTAEIYSEEGIALQAQIGKLEAQISVAEQKAAKVLLETKFPALKDKEQEFEEFRQNPENSGMRIEVAAKAFLVENDLLEVPKVRKGLEKDTGGTRAPIKEGMTAEEVDSLRVNNYREYARRLKAGTLKIG